MSNFLFAEKGQIGSLGAGAGQGQSQGSSPGKAAGGGKEDQRGHGGD